MIVNLKNERQVEKSAVNLVNHSIAVVLSEEVEVVRYSWEEGKYYISLLHGVENVDLSRKDILSVFVNHDTNVLPIGKFENVRIEDGKLKADAVFDEDDIESMKIFKKLAKGFLQSFSVGIDISEKILDKEIDGVRYYKATRWSIQEASVVGVPAIPTAKVGLELDKPLGENPASASNQNLNKGVLEMEFTKEKFEALELKQAEALSKVNTELALSNKQKDDLTLELAASKSEVENLKAEKVTIALESEKIVAMAFKTGVSLELAQDMLKTNSEAQASLIALNAISSKQGNSFTGADLHTSEQKTDLEYEKTCQKLGITIIGENK